MTFLVALVRILIMSFQIFPLGFNLNHQNQDRLRFATGVFKEIHPYKLRNANI